MIRPGFGIVVFCTLGVSACSPWVLEPAGPVGSQERIILLDSLAIMLAIVVPTIVATLAFAFWFRQGNRRARRLPDFSYSGRLELLVWSIPTLVILFLGGIIWVGSHDLDPAKPIAANPLEIDVVAMDWKWLFIYPQQGFASVNRVVVPVNRAVHFRVTSASVFNSFFVPQIGSQIYAMPGMTADLNLAASRLGRFQGLSAQFSGEGFSTMDFGLYAVSDSDFVRWVSAAHKGGAALDENAYRKLLQQSMNVAPYTYRAVAPGLFDAVVMRTLPRGPGPLQGQSAPVGRPMGAQ